MELPDSAIANPLDASTPPDVAAFPDLATLDASSPDLATDLPFRFERSWSGATSDALIFSIAAFDYDLDGTLDLVTPDGNVLIGHGDGTFSAAIVPLLVAGQSVIAGDWNGDGKIDLAFAEPASGMVAVSLLDGPGHLRTLVRYPTAGAAASIAVADMNRDGETDLVVSNSTLKTNGTTVAILYGHGDGSFSAPDIQSTQANNLQEISVGDLLGDRTLSMVVVAADDDNLVVFSEIDPAVVTPFGSVVHQALLPTAPSVAGSGRLAVVVPNGGRTKARAPTTLLYGFKKTGFTLTRAVGPDLPVKGRPIGSVPGRPIGSDHLLRPREHDRARRGGECGSANRIRLRVDGHHWVASFLA